MIKGCTTNVRRHMSQLAAGINTDSDQTPFFIPALHESTDQRHLHS